MLKRSSTAIWHGTGPKGKGSITTTSGALTDQPYGFAARFESADGKAGTNPEELLAAAHAACFTMALSFQLTNAGFEPGELKTVATVSLEKQDAGFTITAIALDVHGSVPGVDEPKFLALADVAKQNCPLSKALSAVAISMTAALDA